MFLRGFPFVSARFSLCFCEVFPLFLRVFPLFLRVFPLFLRVFPFVSVGFFLYFFGFLLFLFFVSQNFLCFYEFSVFFVFQCLVVLFLRFVFF